MKNEYEVRGEVTAIFIDSPKHGRQETLISTSKLDMVKEFPNSWYVKFSKITKSLYVRGNTPRVYGKRRTISLHRWITDFPDGMDVDHFNSDTLNNTDENLRICTRAENGQNRKIEFTNSKSGIRGVTWHARAKKWQVRITINKKPIRFGYFSDISEAERAAIEARAKYMPYSQEASA